MAAPGPREIWSSRPLFILAVLGSSVGLGNLWRFPYLAGQYGGAAFVLVYVIFSIVICLPLVMAEFAIGRSGHRNPLTTVSRLCAAANLSRLWKSIGWLSIFPTLGVLCFFSVVAGWSLDYVLQAVRGTFVGISPEAAQAVFGELQSSPVRIFFWHSLYMAATVFVVALGLRRGIETVSKIMMPGLFLCLLVLIIYAHIEGDAPSAWRFLFRPDFSALSAEGVLMALGQALASVSVGTGALMTYASYASKSVNLAASSWTIVLGDTTVALLAGLAIFPIVFASGLDPASGPGLMFLSLPIAVGNLPGGYWFSILFFVLVFFAAFTSSLSMLEPAVSWLVDKGHPRARSAVVVGATVWILATGSVLSFNVLSDFTPLGFLPGYEGRTLFGILEYTFANLFLPVNALLIALFAGWALNREKLLTEIGIGHGLARRGWSFTIRFLAPLAVGVTLVVGLAG